MRIKKALALGCLFAVCVFQLAGCGQNTNSNQTSAPPETPLTSSQPPVTINQEAKPMVRVGTLQGPAGLGMVELMELNENKKAGNIYEFTMAGAPDELTGKIVSGELDVAAVPTNTAAVLYNKTEGRVKVISTTTLGVLYLLERPQEDMPEITSLSELSGRTVYSTGQGATQEYVLDYLLKKSGADDVTVLYKSEHAELAALLLDGTVDLALLPQPFVTTVTAKDSGIKIALDITKEWETASGGAQMAMGCIVVRDEFLEKNTAAVNRFLEEYASSVASVNGDPDAASALSEKFGVIAGEIARKAIPDCNIVSLVGAEMKTAVATYLEVLFDADPKSVGGALPDDALYYIP